MAINFCEVFLREMGSAQDRASYDSVAIASK